jgi:hypothetical protein
VGGSGEAGHALEGDDVDLGALSVQSFDDRSLPSD